MERNTILDGHKKSIESGESLKELDVEEVKQGSILIMDLNPVAGHKQGGRRPVLVISIGDFYRLTGEAVVVPITSKDKRYRMIVELPSSLETSGIVLCQHIRSVDVNQRHARKVEQCSDEVVKSVLEITDEILHK